MSDIELDNHLIFPHTELLSQPNLCPSKWLHVSARVMLRAIVFFFGQAAEFSQLFQKVFLNALSSHSCSDTSMLASTIHLWATICGTSLLVPNSLVHVNSTKWHVHACSNNPLHTCYQNPDVAR
jgi:hypothetical protein